jgi:hypothetical protein
MKACQKWPKMPVVKVNGSKMPVFIVKSAKNAVFHSKIGPKMPIFMVKTTKNQLPTGDGAISVIGSPALIVKIGVC